MFGNYDTTPLPFPHLPFAIRLSNIAVHLLTLDYRTQTQQLEDLVKINHLFLSKNFFSSMFCLPYFLSLFSSKALCETKFFLDREIRRC